MTEFPKIKGYTIQKKLGHGGMAAVFLGVQNKLKRLVAIKLLVPNVFGDHRTAKRFLKEGRTLSRLNHPNIISVYEVGQVENYYFIVMEYLQTSLKEMIKRKGRIQPHQALHIALPVADALFYIHKKGLIHRDIKPENIMFRKDGTPVLLDFGIAKTIGSQTRLTKTGASIGTPQYMSPEQCAAQHLDGRSDIYSLGVVIYEMLTGKVPYKAKDTRAMVMKHLNEPVPGLPFSLARYQELINRMMVKDKKKRLRSQRELQEICKNLLPGVILGSTSGKRSKKKISRKGSVSTQKNIPLSSSKKNAVKKSRSPVKRHPARRKKSKKPSKKKFFRHRQLLWILLIFVVTILSFKVISGYSFKEMMTWISQIINKIGKFLFSLLGDA